MTEQERKQFINEYCRNVGDIKIRCDDCKFVENCVDYGWQECKKFTPTPSEPMTNEEYIRTCSTAELVHVIHLMTTSCYVCGSDGVDYRRCYFRKQCTGPKEIEEWLKEPHPKWS